jgi:hypothetical protein
MHRREVRASGMGVAEPLRTEWVAFFREARRLAALARARRAAGAPACSAAPNVNAEDVQVGVYVDGRTLRLQERTTIGNAGESHVL